MKRGYLKTYVKTIIVIAIIIIGIVYAVYLLRNKYNDEQLETVKTNMLLIEAKTKVIAQKVKIKEKDASYIGIKIENLSEDAEIKALQENKIIDKDLKDSIYYALNESNLEELGLNDINLKEGYYIVEYNNNEIIYSKGVKDKDGSIKYKLSEVAPESENQEGK